MISVVSVSKHDEYGTVRYFEGEETRCAGLMVFLFFVFFILTQARGGEIIFEVFPQGLDAEDCVPQWPCLLSRLAICMSLPLG